MVGRQSLKLLGPTLRYFNPLFVRLESLTYLLTNESCSRQEILSKFEVRVLGIPQKW
jgi:hypothetical protein